MGKRISPSCSRPPQSNIGPWAPKVDIDTLPQFEKRWGTHVDIGAPAQSEAMGRRPGYRVALPRGPGHPRSTSARLLKSHGPKIRILKRASPGPWAPEVDIGTPPQELSGTHPTLTRASPRPWAPEADIGTPPQEPLGADPNTEVRFPKLWARFPRPGT